MWQIVAIFEMAYGISTYSRYSVAIDFYSQVNSGFKKYLHI